MVMWTEHVHALRLRVCKLAARQILPRKLYQQFGIRGERHQCVSP
jgi:hypothetical protein